ncbi:MAG: cysteine methyltransferase [Candidatus Aenigmatarchaeota archaeon]|nr:MAG: cysteine methyltransferase [Candidatus Aenigmarchaeota archaeon]
MKRDISKRNLIYNLLQKVPKGKAISYGELARIGKTSARAVGMFMKTNRDIKKIPCYKVVRSDGKIGGYSGPGGVKKKMELLKKDGIKIEIKKGTPYIRKKYIYKFNK